MTDNTNFNDLTALFINCSLKKSAKDSHTLRLMKRAAGVMRQKGVKVEILHALDYNIAFGMEKDLTKHGWDQDDWPKIQKKIMDADILVLGTPIWLGQKSSIATLVIERMYAYSGDLNDKDQYLYYGKTAGCIVTGNEDGIKHCSMDILYAMQHIGYSIPPQADCGWIGEAGPGPSYGDTEWNNKKLDKPQGYDNNFTNRNTTFMSWNLMHMAKMLNNIGGFPTTGNQTNNWEDVANANEQKIE